MSKYHALILMLLFLGTKAWGQDSLPKFSVKNRSGKVIVGWVNPFKDVVLINIQRSPDSLKGYKTILNVADPRAITNGYLDSKAPNTDQYYRLYVQQSGGRYFFTTPHKPIIEERKKPAPKPAPTETAISSNSTATTPAKPQNADSVEKVVDAEAQGFAGKLERNTVARKKFSNSVSVGVGSVEADAPESEFHAPSVHVYTNSSGQVVVALPPQKTNLYTLKFYKDDGTPLFTMQKVRDNQLTIDKTNFIRSGWFKFELYENNVMKEKNRFFIPKEN